MDEDYVKDAFKNVGYTVISVREIFSKDTGWVIISFYNSSHIYTRQKIYSKNIKEKNLYGSFLMKGFILLSVAEPLWRCKLL